MYAHRGIHRDAKTENKLQPFRRALKDMDGFECDVRYSHDDIPVVIHDVTLNRTHGVSQRVVDMSASDLQFF